LSPATPLVATQNSIVAIGDSVIELVASLSIFIAAIAALDSVLAAIKVELGAPAVVQLPLDQPLDHHLLPPRINLVPLETVSLS
jgi:hypothetical protein